MLERNEVASREAVPGSRAAVRETLRGKLLLRHTRGRRAGRGPVLTNKAEKSQQRGWGSRIASPGLVPAALFELAEKSQCRAWIRRKKAPNMQGSQAYNLQEERQEGREQSQSPRPWGEGRGSG